MVTEGEKTPILIWKGGKTPDVLSPHKEETIIVQTIEKDTSPKKQKEERTQTFVR